MGILPHSKHPSVEGEQAVRVGLLACACVSGVGIHVWGGTCAPHVHEVCVG